jgi:hypothetical protein
LLPRWIATQGGRNEQIFTPIVSIEKPIELMRQRFVGLTDFGSGTVGQEIVTQSPSTDAPFPCEQMPVEILGYTNSEPAVPYGGQSYCWYDKLLDKRKF